MKQLGSCNTAPEMVSFLAPAQQQSEANRLCLSADTLPSLVEAPRGQRGGGSPTVALADRHFLYSYQE